MNRNHPGIGECAYDCGHYATVQLWVADLADVGVGAWLPLCHHCATTALQREEEQQPEDGLETPA